MQKLRKLVTRIALSLLRIVSLIFAIIYVVVCAILFVNQRSIIYAPTQLPEAALQFVEKLSTSDAELALSVRNGSGRDAIIYFGGNAEDVSRRLRALGNFFPEHGVFLQHYRGYGGSTGEPSEMVLHADAQAVYDLVQSRYENIVVIGRSLGSGVAIRLAANNPVSHLVLLTPYDSILNVGKGLFPFVPMKLLLVDEFQSVRYAPEIEIPTLIIKAENDRVVPHHLTDALIEEFIPGVVSTVTIEGAEHNSIWGFEDTYRYMTDFLGE